jgi:GxxExxY protein
MSIRQIANDVWSKLGPGYSESVYHSAFEVGLRTFGLYYETERIVPVFYLGQNVGHVRADLIVDRKTVIELKSVSKINESYRIQTKNYMDLLGLDHGYLINFPDRTADEPEIEEFSNKFEPTERIDC